MYAALQSGPICVIILPVHDDSRFLVECVTHGKSSARDSALSITRESETLLVSSLHCLNTLGPREGIGHRNVAEIFSFNQLSDPDFYVSSVAENKPALWLQ